MTAIVSGGDGNWSSTTEDAPWDGGVVPGENDTVIILSGHTVTINQNVIVGADSTSGLVINSGGKLQVLHDVAGSYSLTVKGDFTINGTFEVGTVAEPLAAATTFTVMLNYSASLAEGEYGMKIGVSSAATVTLQGAVPWGTSYYATTLDVDAVATDTHVHTAVNTGWKDNNVLVVAATRRTYTEHEALVMNGDAADDVVSFDAPASLAYPHSGTSPTAAEIINLTRNIKITSYNASYNGFVSIANASTAINWDWVEFSELGNNATGEYGVDFITNALSTAANIKYCSFYNNNVHIRNSIASNNLDIQDCVFYNSASYPIYLQSSCATLTLSNIHIIYGLAYLIYVYGAVSSGTFSYCYLSGGITNALHFYDGNWSGLTISNIVAHSCGTCGFYLDGMNLTASNITAWRNANYGISVSGQRNFVLTDVTTFGNTNEGIMTSGYGVSGRITNWTSNSEASYASVYALYVGDGHVDFVIENASLGETTTYTNGSCYLQYATGKITFVKSVLTGTNETHFYYLMQPNATIYSHDHDDNVGTHKCWKREGIIETDTTADEYHTTAPSEKLTPYYAAYKLESHPKYITCASAATPTVKVWVRKSALYDGDEPRLVLKRNYAAGVTTDTVLDTMTAAVETWEQLSGAVTAPSEDTVYELVVDCADATVSTHYINVDDWTVEY